MKRTTVNIKIASTKWEDGRSLASRVPQPSMSAGVTKMNRVPHVLPRIWNTTPRLSTKNASSSVEHQNTKADNMCRFMLKGSLPVAESTELG